MGDGESIARLQDACSPAEYVSLLRRVRSRSGLSFRTIQRHAAAKGHTLPPSTLATMLGRDTLPAERLVTALLVACGESDETLAGWVEARRRIATAGIVTEPVRRLVTDDPAPRLAARDSRAWRQLPMDIEEFTGRRPQLRQLLAVDDGLPGTTGRTAATVMAITGMAGIGKTRLAVHAGHRLVRAGRFDEIQLWTDLRGFDPHQCPVDPATVLETFLHALGVPGERIPNRLEARAAFYRDRLTDRRALVILDNAADEDQIRPLLPGGASNLVLVTSRRTLTTLEGARHLELDLFTPEEAMALLVRLAGPHRVHADLVSARGIAELCGYLPLAVTLAARRLAARPTWSTKALAARLEHQDHRLNQLSGASWAVRGIFDVSYRSLPPHHKRLFRLLGTSIAMDIDLGAAAALADLPTAEAERALEDLLDEHLLTQASPGRYRMHDLIRLFARERARQDEPAGEIDTAFSRLMRHYAASAEQATRLLHTTESRRLTAAAPDGGAESRMTTPEHAARWVEDEHRNLLAIAEHAAHAPPPVPELMIRLITVLYRPLINLGLSSTHIRLIQVAAASARRIGDRHAEAQLLEDLGTVCGQAGRLPDAIEHNSSALGIWRDLGDHTGQAGCLIGLGITHHQQRNYPLALACLQEALVVAGVAGYRIGEASILNYLGLVHQSMGRFDDAIRLQQRSIEVYQEVGSKHGEAIALANLGWTYQRSGCPHDAVDLHQLSLAIFTSFGDRYNEAEQHWGLGQAHYALGDSTKARDNWDRSITILRELDAIGEQEAAMLRAEPVPRTPEIIRLNS